jgi:hypothetical protein
MELFPDSKGYATRENAIKKLREMLPRDWFDDLRWLIVALPNGRFLPMVKISNTGCEYAAANLARCGIGVI